MSKASVIHMTRAMALEWGKFGINSNALCPGYIDTEINHHVWQTEAGQKLIRSEEHTSELQSRTVISYAVFWLQPPTIAFSDSG